MNNKIYFTNDNQEIIDYLTDAGVRFENYNSNKIFTFLFKGNYHLVLFLANPGEKGFFMFRIANIKNNSCELNNLNLMLQGFLELNPNLKIIKEAISQVQIMKKAQLSADIFKTKRTL